MLLNSILVKSVPDLMRLLAPLYCKLGGIRAFQYEVQQILGIDLDVIPTFGLPKNKDQDYVKSVQTEAIAL
jgi:hypothetical protein